MIKYPSILLLLSFEHTIVTSHIYISIPETGAPSTYVSKYVNRTTSNLTQRLYRLRPSCHTTWFPPASYSSYQRAWQSLCTASLQCLYASECSITPILSISSISLSIISCILYRIERLKPKCVDLSNQCIYFNPIWYRTQIPHCQHTRIAKFT